MGALKSMVGNPGKTLAGLWRETAPHTSFAIAYSPTSGFACEIFPHLLWFYLSFVVAQRSLMVKNIFPVYSTFLPEVKNVFPVYLTVFPVYLTRSLGLLRLCLNFAHSKTLVLPVVLAC